MEDRSDGSTKTQLAIESADKLSAFKPLVDDAKAFAEQWDDPYRTHVFQTVLTHLISDGRLPSSPETKPDELAQEFDSDRDSPLSKLSRSVNVDANLLRRVIEIDEEGNVQILGRLEKDGDSISERQNKYSVVYALIKERALGTTTVDIEELRSLCVQNNCYNQANFT